jgi:hypothetical protein
MDLRRLLPLLAVAAALPLTLLAQDAPPPAPVPAQEADPAADPPPPAPPAPPAPAPPTPPPTPLSLAPLPATLPEPLLPWASWTTWDLSDLTCPPAHHDASLRLCLWPSRLLLKVTPAGATFSLEVTAFSPAWLALPGDARHWPAAVTLDGQPVPVLQRSGAPAIKLPTGTHTITGNLSWHEMPQQLALPPQIGLLDLSIAGQPVASPSWDADGTLWLQRQAAAEPVDEDFLSLKVHSLLEDGIPLWFESQVELIVAGKSREETLGAVLPAGWQLASIDSPLPVAIDEAGTMKAQLRAGRWLVTLRAFHTSQPAQIAFSEGVEPAAADQPLAFRPLPEFRQAELVGLPQIDVSQTQVPEPWRSLPIYRWDTSAPFSLAERVRGAGQRDPANISIQRSLWLDDDGRALTFRDTLSGPVREIRRLDAAAGHLLGSVRSGEESQLITRNPNTGAPGFEVRAPLLAATATGRIDRTPSLAATGWQADADQLSATLDLPPGWRLFALLGADYSQGDWLTAWSLLDIFLLLLFSLAILRLRGLLPALVAFLAFGLAYHEPNAPRVAWLLLLIPVALAQHIPAGLWRNIALGLKWTAAAILLLSLAPFAASQIQAALFPQLERLSPRSISFGDTARTVASAPAYGYEQALEEAADDAMDPFAPAPENIQRQSAPLSSAPKSRYMSKDNLKVDPKAVIQTGPGVPEWTWRRVSFGWDGPVAASQELRPILIPPAISRPLALLRVILLVLLAAALLRPWRKPATPPSQESPDPADAAPSPQSPPSTGQAAAAAIAALALLLFSHSPQAHAQFPQQELLDELHQRLTTPSDAFPDAVDVASAALALDGDSFVLTVELHAADRAAAPLPDALKAWVPSSATFADGTPVTLLRRDGQLWALLPASGIHTITLAGRLRDLSDWEWNFALKPRRVEVTAPGWNVSGIRPDGTPEDQLLFSQIQRADAATTASYDRPDTRHALLVERQIELGLVWHVRTTVTRLSPPGRAVALKLPLLPGEKVVSQGRTVEDGSIEVRLAPDATELSWEGELPPTPTLTLATREPDTWTERWRLVASPVWNVELSGLAPVFEAVEDTLTPLWQAWPGESATLAIGRPEAVPGASVTVDRATHTLNPGRRQRSSSLSLSLRSSLGEDFPITLPADAEVTSLSHDGSPIPVRKDRDAVVVPLRPGAQQIDLAWRTPASPGPWTLADPIALPVEVANLSTVFDVPRDRWTLWADGPQRGPAVRFWAVLVFAVIAASTLSRVPRSPLKLREWLLLSLGFTQVPVALSLIVVGWLFLTRWRGTPSFQSLPPWAYNTCQAILIGLTLTALVIFIVIAAAGLLGQPEMFIGGNGSTRSRLDWFLARSSPELATPGFFSISIWFYRLAMLLWALWLATALIRWLRTAWQHSSTGGHFRPPAPPPARQADPSATPATTPSPSPTQSTSPPTPPNLPSS